ncbi:hypothetical protein ACJ72_05912, partial [Emergomyces africanus]
MLGPLPKEWKGLYVDPESSLDMWYDQNREPAPKTLLKQLLHIDVRTQHALSVLSRRFNYISEKRLTATQLLQGSSFKALIHNY